MGLVLPGFVRLLIAIVSTVALGMISTKGLVMLTYCTPEVFTGVDSTTVPLMEVVRLPLGKVTSAGSPITM